MADDKIKYSDLIVPDDSIEYLILQLDDLNKQYGTMVNAIRAGAKEIVYAMKSINATSAENRTAIDESAAAASRLERAQKELKFAMSDTGKQVAWLKSQISETNKSSVQQQNIIRALDTSYNKLKLELKENVQLWQSLTAAERQDAAMGGQILSNILNLKNSIQLLDAELKTEVIHTTEVQKAQERLNYLRSEEGQKLIALKKEISEVLRGHKEEKQNTDKLVAAQEKLVKAKSVYNQLLINVNNQIREANRVAKLTAQVNNSATGSYNQLAAQYELNKIKLNAMSQEERRAVDSGQKLEAETLRIYKQMILLQEATGNHRLSVGHYTKAWNGLGNAMNQIVREVPAMTMGINTFMLAISNNVPILIDEIARVREQNKLLRAEGKPTQNVAKTIASALFGWQTALILVMTALSMHGKEIIDWCKKVIKGHGIVKTMNELLDDLQEELKTTNASYGQNIVAVKKLQQEWSKLSSKQDQLKWIKANKAEFDKLGISINGITEAENAFVDNTDAIIESLKQRAKAAAAMQLASKKYEESLVKRNEAETEKNKKPSWIDEALGGLKYGAFTRPIGTYAIEKGANEEQKQRILNLNDEAQVAEKDADAFFDLAKGYEAAADAALENANIKKKFEGTKLPKTPKGRQPRDLTDTINKNEISLQKKYETSITALQHDEYVKRRKEAMDATQTEIAELKEKYRKNEEYVKNVEGKYKALTDEQKAQIAEQQGWIINTIVNANEKLKYELEQIEKERQINSLKIMRETINWQLEDIANSINDEKELRLKQLEQEEIAVKKTNNKVEEGYRTEAEITAEYQKKRMQIIAEYGQQILRMRDADIAAQLEVVKKGSEDELDLLLQQNEIARKLALSENKAKPIGKQQSEASINSIFDKKAQNITGSFTMTSFDEAQALALATFNIVKHSENETTKFKLQQEKERWEKQIALAESGALNWSDTQIDAAKATVKGIERQIKETDNFVDLISDKGLGGALLSKLGFDDDQIAALEEAVNIAIEQLEAIAQAEVDLAQMAVDKAKERVEAAQNAYDAEVEARANGYANNVATAKKELQQEKKNQQEKEKILAAAQKRQEALDTVSQTSSLITASALLWKSFAGTGVAAPFLAAAAIAAMWTSFAVAKVKAAQVTKTASQEYGEGGIEFLEGGSHASGNDIDLQTKNSKGKNMRAEGGEALAVINRRSTRRYRRQLPSIIDSLNKGTFEEKYLKAFEHGETLQAQIIATQANIDLTKVEQLVDEIRKQNSQKFITLSDGTAVEIKGNVTRYYK